MIVQARETRKKVTNAPVAQEELDAFPVTIKTMVIPTRVGDSNTFYSYTETGKNSDVLVINFHGGSFIRERTPNDELFCRKLNHALKCKTIDVDYRIAPDEPYPTAVFESYDVVQWAFQHTGELDVAPKKIILN